MVTEIARIQDQLRRAFEGPAWHGPSLHELLSNVPASKAAARPIEGAHSIWELVLHIIAWERVVVRRLAGETIDKLSPAEDWPAINDTGERAWSEAQAQLQAAHQELHEAIGKFPEARLGDKVSGKYPYYGLLHGVIQHNLYHAGQIAILKKA